MAHSQALNVALNTSLLLLPTVRTWRPGDHSKASLDKRKGTALLVAYALILLICAPLLLSLPDEGGARL